MGPILGRFAQYFHKIGGEKKQNFLDIFYAAYNQQILRAFWFETCI